MTKSQREHKRQAAKKKRAEIPPVDTLTVAWMTTLATCVMTEFGALAARLYVRYIDRNAKLLSAFSSYLLLAAAIIGIVLIILTPIVVKRKRSNPPVGIVAFAYFIGAAPWAAMLFQAME